MIQDNQTGKRESLKTKDKHEALEMLLLRNRPCQQAGFHAQMARTHLLVSNPQNANRTWQSVMDSIVSKKTGATQIRWQRAAECEPFDIIRNLKVANTSSDDFDKVLNAGGVSVNVYLRRLHNFALDMNWLLAPVKRFPAGLLGLLELGNVAFKKVGERDTDNVIGITFHCTPPTVSAAMLFARPAFFPCQCW